MSNLYPSNMSKKRAKKEANTLKKKTGITYTQALNIIALKYTGMDWDTSHKRQKEETTLSFNLNKIKLKLPYEKSLTLITSNCHNYNRHFALDLACQFLYQGQTIYFLTCEYVPKWDKVRNSSFLERQQVSAMQDFAPERFIWLNFNDDDEFYRQKKLQQIKLRPGILIIDDMVNPYECPEEDSYFNKLLEYCEHAVIASEDLSHLKRCNSNSFEQKNKQIFIGVSHRLNYNKQEKKDQIASVRVVIEETLSCIHLSLTEDEITRLSALVAKLEHINHYCTDWLRVFRNKIEEHYDLVETFHSDLTINTLQ
jgi:hypothetical protein